MYIGKLFMEDKDKLKKILDSPCYLLTDNGVVEDNLDSIYELKIVDYDTNPKFAIFKKYGTETIYLAFKNKPTSELVFKELSKASVEKVQEFIASAPGYDKGRKEWIKHLTSKNIFGDVDVVASQVKIVGTNYSFVNYGLYIALYDGNRQINDFSFKFDVDADRYDRVAMSFLYEDELFFVLEKYSPYYKTTTFDLWKISKKNKVVKVNSLSRTKDIVIPID